jgi:hypothetical protein
MSLRTGFFFVRILPLFLWRQCRLRAAASALPFFALFCRGPATNPARTISLLPSSNMPPRRASAWVLLLPLLAAAASGLRPHAARHSWPHAARADGALAPQAAAIESHAPPQRDHRHRAATEPAADACHFDALFPAFLHQAAPALKAAVEEACMRHQLHTQHANPIVRRMRLVSLLATDERHKRAFNDFFRDVTASTKVDILVSSFNRPAQLYKALESMRTFFTNCDITVSYEADDEATRLAYEHVLARFPVAAMWRPDYGGYMQSMRHAMAQTNATNFIVASDDTFAVRPLDCKRHGALLRLVAGNEERVNRATMLLRIDYSINTSPIIQSIMAPMLPYVFAVDCSKSALGMDAMLNGTVPVCSDRHIDGAMYTAGMVRREWRNFTVGRDPVNPGDSEALWIDERMRTIGDDETDISLFPADQIYVNTGMDIGTVREERKFLESAEFGHAKAVSRQQDNARVLSGCRPLVQAVLPPFLKTSWIQHNDIAVQWTCHEG